MQSNEVARENYEMYFCIFFLVFFPYEYSFRSVINKKKQLCNTYVDLLPFVFLLQLHTENPLINIKLER